MRDSIVSYKDTSPGLGAPSLAPEATTASPKEAAWPWMGARWSELMLWQELVGLLADIASGAFDVDADLAIRRRMLNAYVANRAVLGRKPGGVEVFVRPAIEARLVREETAEAAVMAWLDAESGDPDSTWREAVRGGRIYLHVEFAGVRCAKMSILLDGVRTISQTNET